MKILYIHSDQISLNDIPWGLLELKQNVEIYTEEVTLQKYIQEEKLILSNYLNKHDFKIAIMHNFSPSVSEACQENNIKYISWIYDSPVWELYSPYAKNECNYIFVFDKMQYERLKQKGFHHLFYIPLATNVSRNSTLIVNDEDERKYKADISFVGKLYRDNNYNNDSGKLPLEIIKYFDFLIRKHSLNWEHGFSPIGSIEYKYYKVLQDWITLPLEAEEDRIYFIEVCFLCRKIAEIERVSILNTLALNHNVHLYTYDDTSDLNGVIIHPGVNNVEECPKVYHLSKINLNITLRSIESGVPQRVLDIMSVGGFVLSNYQRELEELFIPNKEIVLFYNMQDLLYKVNYYLSHEKERLQIAMNGYKKVMNYYSYPILLKKILNIIKD